MKLKYKIVLICLAFLLMYSAKQSHAVQIEIAVGSTEYQKSSHSDWWQKGPASEGFYDNFNLKTTSYRIGVSDYATPSVRYRIGYANLGSVSSKAGATRFDSEYDFQNNRCVDVNNCEMVDYIGSGSVDGYYFTLAPEYKAGNWSAFFELGLWLYNPKFSMSKHYASGVVEPLDIKSGPKVGPVGGIGVRNGSMALTARMYQTNYDGHMDTGHGIPAIYQGYATEISLELQVRSLFGI